MVKALLVLLLAASTASAALPNPTPCTATVGATDVTLTEGKNVCDSNGCRVSPMFPFGLRIVLTLFIVAYGQGAYWLGYWMGKTP